MLTNVYFSQFSWIFHGVSRDQIDEMLPVIYRKPTASSSDEDYTGPHDLALLFVVLAIGSLVDGDRGAEQAARFHQVSKAAICPAVCLGEAVNCHCSMPSSHEYIQRHEWR